VVWAPTIDLAAIHARLRGLPFVHVCATALSLTPLDLVVWAKADAGSVNLYRSQHELLLLFTSEINNDPRLPLVCWFSDARITGASTREGSRRPKTSTQVVMPSHQYAERGLAAVPPFGILIPVFSLERLMISEFGLNDYLARIGFRDSVEPNFPTLAAFSARQCDPF
jgi:hypothetical protein